MQDEAAMSFRLSPQQELLWSMHPAGPEGGAVVAVDVHGDADEARLRGALNALADRHEILRTTFPRRVGMRLPLQVVNETLTPGLSAIDLTGLPPSQQETQLAALLDQQRGRTWDYDNGPLVQATMARLAPTHIVLVLAIAPPCGDTGSLATAVHELAGHYGGATVADDPLQYADFAEWQQQLLEGDDEEAEAGRRFWAELDLGPVRSLPFVRAGAPASTEEIEVALSDPAAVDTAAAQVGVPADALVQAALHVVAARAAGADVPLAVVPGRRIHAELASALGAFARALP